MRLFTKIAEKQEDAPYGNLITATNQTLTVNATDIERMGTQRVYGRNGTNIIIKLHGDDRLLIVPNDWNTQFCRKIKKVLPGKRQHPAPQDVQISLIWASPDDWAPVVDNWAGIGK